MYGRVYSGTANNSGQKLEIRNLNFQRSITK